MQRTSRLTMAILIAVAWSQLCVAAEKGTNTAKAAWASLFPQGKVSEPDAFVENDPKLPNVLLYGDSISVGYTLPVRRALRGKANVYRIYSNGGASSSFIPKMKKMHEVMRDPQLPDRWTFDWKVIHFNVGLHDLKYIGPPGYVKATGRQVTPPPIYAKNLREIIVYLKRFAPKATLIFATTTPVPEGAPLPFVGDADQYNETARKVLKDYPDLLINDLNAFTKPNQPQWWESPGNVHFNRQGQQAQGEEVAREILKALDRRQPAR